MSLNQHFIINLKVVFPGRVRWLRMEYDAGDMSIILTRGVVGVTDMVRVEQVLIAPG